MSSDNDWRDAYGDLRLPFFGAAGKILDGDFHVNCPNCGKHTLRFYYHKFDAKKNSGTLWAWCPNCHMTVHLPRVTPQGWDFPDPFADLDLDAFAEIEESDEPFMKRLDRLWVQGKIGLQEPMGPERGRPKPARR